MEYYILVGDGGEVWMFFFFAFRFVPFLQSRTPLFDFYTRVRRVFFPLVQSGFCGVKKVGRHVLTKQIPKATPAFPPFSSPLLSSVVFAG
jgi:hypothetical protein